MTVNPIRVVLALCIWTVLMFAATAFYLWQWLNTPQQVTLKDPVFVIESGASLSTVATELAQQDMLRWPKVWVFYGRLMNLSKIRIGEYQLSEKESPIGLLTRFQTGEQIHYHITLVEGRTMRDFLATLHSHNKLGNTLDGKSYPEIVSALGLAIENPEGYFFPDTYQFVKGDTDRDILLRAHLRMNKILHQEWQNRADNLPYSKPYEALIMASIVEKETGVAYERKEIAGVFVRRLQKHMRLQTDPTVIYGLGEDYSGNLTRADLKRPTAYNTYTINGLPPTPIAMPGKEAIKAALHPASGKALYFVAKGDGSHYFSATLEEHEKAVRQYQLRRRSDYRSSPATGNSEQAGNEVNSDASR
ncbi:UPF0755 protein [Alteromonadaceae bacterium 2753L.S.0a.02]|nr:UPF0755 protein [Alteromonadaceae bacterium 2753L.S.0a.02]